MTPWLFTTGWGLLYLTVLTVLMVPALWNSSRRWLAVAMILLFAIDRVSVNALHPGVVSTKLLTEGFGMTGPDSVADGAATSVMLALDPEYAHVTGQYFAACRPAPMNPVAHDRVLSQAFFAETLRIAQNKKGLPESW